METEMEICSRLTSQAGPSLARPTGGSLPGLRSPSGLGIRASGAADDQEENSHDDEDYASESDGSTQPDTTRMNSNIRDRVNEMNALGRAGDNFNPGAGVK